MKPDDEEGKNPNLVTTLASVAIDTAKLIAGVPLEYSEPLLTPPATVPPPAKEGPVMDDEKEKSTVDQMTDVVADAAGELARTAVKAVTPSNSCVIMLVGTLLLRMASAAATSSNFFSEPADRSVVQRVQAFHPSNHRYGMAKIPRRWAFAACRGGAMAYRGHPGTQDAGKWVSMEPAFKVVEEHL